MIKGESGCDCRRRGMTAFLRGRRQSCLGCMVGEMSYYCLIVLIIGGVGRVGRWEGGGGFISVGET